MSLCRSNRFLLHKHFFFVCTFLFNSHCKSPAASLLHSVFKTAFAAHYGDKSTKNILLPQIFPHLFIQQIKKEKHFSSFPFLKTAISPQIIWSFHLKSVIFQHHFILKSVKNGGEIILKSVNGTRIEAKIYIFLMLYKSFFRFLRLYKQNSIKKQT